MYTRLLQWAAGGAAWLLTALAVSAQTPDPGFTPPALRQAATISSLALQADGKRLVVSTATEAEGQPANALLRYNADGTLDQGFRAAVAGYSWSPEQVLPLAGGKVLLSGGAFQAGTVQRNASLIRLNADGSLDAGFDADARPNNRQYLAMSEQPDGKVVVSGTFTQFGTATAPGLVRLLPDGTRDAGFAPSGFTAPSPRVMAHALQPDGKLLVTGTLTSPSTPTLLRLNADGSTDASFTAPSLGTLWALALQPDGKIITASTSQIRRLLPDGSADNTFAPLTTPGIFTKLLVQPDGSILAATNFGGSAPTPGGMGSLIRILPTGARDASFQLPASWSPVTFGVTGLARQADGRLLIGTNRIVYPTAGSLDARTLLLLEPTGARSLAWQPLPLTAGRTESLALQPDGSVLVAGHFTRCGEAPVGGIVRLQPDGRADTAFNRKAAVSGTVYQVKVHPAGGALIGGDFARVGTTSSRALVRLLPSGELDPSFAYQPSSTFNVTLVQHLAVLPDGAVMVHGVMPTTGSSGVALQRLQANGQPDAAFSYTQPNSIAALTFLPDGRTVVATRVGVTTTANVERLLATGAPDPTFAAFSLPSAYVEALAVDAQGRLLFTHINYPANGNNRTYRVVRYTANTNVPDPTFTPVQLRFNDFVFDIVEQPNGRIMLAGLFPGTNGAFHPLMRVLADGQPDATFATATVEGEGQQLLVQPDGKLLLGGYILKAGTLLPAPVLRLSAAGVLAAAPAARAAATQVWPVPAHDELRVAVDAAARPTQVALLDATGRVVLRQPVRQAELRLPVRQLPAGVYLLRVDYAQGPVTRRVVVQ